MSDERGPVPDLRAVWKSQPRELGPVALEKVRKDARRSQRRLWRAMAIEFGASAVVVAINLMVLLRDGEPYQKAVAVLMDAWIVFYLWRWVRAFGPRRLPDDAVACLDFHRSQLERMRGELLRSWRWAVAPVAGIALIILVFRLTGPTTPGRAPWFDHLIMAVSLAFVAESLLLMWLWMLHRADKLQDRIDELDALGREP
jgi:hypothetical protein